MTFLGIIVATIVAFIWSSVYYSQAGVGKSWLKLVGLKKDDMDLSSKKMTKMVFVTFLLYFVQFFIMAFLFDRIGIMSYSSAITVAILMMLFAESGNIVYNMYEHKKTSLALIHIFDSSVRYILGACVLVWMM